MTSAAAVRGDLGLPEGGVEELEECSILGRRFLWSILLDVKPSVRVDARLDTESLCTALADRSGQLPAGACRPELRRSTLFLYGGPRDVAWVYVSVSGAPWPVAYALEVEAVNRGCELVPYALFDPALVGAANDLADNEYNEAVAAAFTRAANSADAKRWLSEVHEVAMRVVAQVRGQALSRASDGLF